MGCSFLGGYLINRCSVNLPQWSHLSIQSIRHVPEAEDVTFVGTSCQVAHLSPGLDWAFSEWAGTVLPTTVYSIKQTPSLRWTSYDLSRRLNNV